jgi:hypothetical protein
MALKKGVFAMMRSLLFTAAATGVLMFWGGSSANAQYGHHYGYGHHRLHQDLDHREFHRRQYHAERHQFPQTRYEHFRLHQDLDHDGFHDALRHRSHHYRYRSGYNRSGFGLGISRRGLSLYFGR